LSQASLIPLEGSSLLFVVPALGRVDLARICYRQLAEMRDELRFRGLLTDILVISDDGNLDAAETEGFATLHHEQKPGIQLGDRLNNGYVWAADHGYDYVCPIGNDSWMHPDRIRWLPDGETLLCTRNYACVNSDATQQAHLRLDYPGGAGSRIIPLRLLERYDYRPLKPNQSSGCDTGTLMAMCRGVMRAPNVVYTDLHPAEIVGFQSADVQVTKWRWWLQHDHTLEEPFHGLAYLYGDHLVTAIRDHYATVLAAV